MKFKKVIDLCKKSGKILLFNNPKDDIQWISDGAAIYPLENLPTLNDEYICNMYDITDSQRDKLFFKFENNLPEFLNFEDSSDSEIIVNRLDMSVVIGSGILIPIVTEQGLMFIQQKHLAPLSDMPEDQMRIYVRTDSKGITYFAIKFGLLLYALIYPIDIIDNKFVNDLKYLYESSKVVLFNKGKKSNEENSV